MNSVERVKTICKERKIPISKLEKDLGYANGYIGQLKKGVFPEDRLFQIADYLNVSPEFLMTGEESEYYFSRETAKFAQEVFEKDRVLFDVYRSDSKEKLVEYAKMLKAMKELEEGN